MITNLVVISRIGKMDLMYERIDMGAMAESIFRLVVDPEVAAGFDFVVGELPEADADAPLIERVWGNYLSNAVKYSIPSLTHRIEAGGREEGGMNVYSVKDFGVGFDQLFAHKLFGMFQRLHDAKDFEGNGIGLAIVQRIIAKHGGKVWAEGRPGAGATFYFSLPVRS